MLSETPADAQSDEAKSSATSANSGATTVAAATKPPDVSKAEVEYDDFGLPIRKRRPRTPVSETSDSSDEGEKFEDTVASKAAGHDIEELARVDKQDDSTGKTPGLVTEIVPEEAKSERKAPPRINDRAEDTNSNAGHTENDQKSTGKEDAVGATSAMKENREEETKDAEKQTLKKDGVEESVEKKETPDKHVDDKGDGDLGTQQLQSTQQSSAASATAPAHRHQTSIISVNEYSHQHAVLQPKQKEEVKEDEGEWQTMPAYAHYDMYDDDNRLIAKENAEELEDMSGYANVGGAAKGYTRVIMDDDADSQTSLDDNTAYLFKEKSTALADEDEEGRDPLSQLQTTKNLLTEGQRVAYVGLVRLAMVEMGNKLSKIERKSKSVKKMLDMHTETSRMWAQKIMVRLYGHMDINASEQIMIEQLSEHGVVPADLVPALMQNARVKNPAAEEPEASDSTKDGGSARPSVSSPRPQTPVDGVQSRRKSDSSDSLQSSSPPPYEQHHGDDYPEVKKPSQLPKSKNLDIDLRWTVLCDLFLVLIADSVYDSRSRELFEQVGKYLSVDWLEICRFEKRVTDALEMQEQADKENWNEDEHMVNRAKRARNKRLAFMGLATVGGGLVIGLSAGLLAPLIGAGLAAGFTTIGVAGTSTFLAGAGGAAIITSTGVVTGSTVGVRAANRRTGAVKTFEYRPLHNNKRTHLIITLAGWMNGKVDDVRLPYSTVDPVMGDIYSVLWEPEMLRSMGATINILATEALTQGLQQVLGSTILTALMAAMTLPLALTKLSYLIDNPWVVSQARADMAGLILADSLIDRNLGTRPVTLVGFSLGSRVIFSCLKELANRGAFGVVQNVYMFGTPVVAKNDDYVRARSIVPGRFVNGYATNDWILGYLFRATSGGVMRVAGLAPVQVPTIENVNVTELVPGHMAYRAAMPKLLREVGWIVESDEFAEIEDPDPDNHELRQRELINEIEEARKELEKKNAEKEKRGGKLSWWKKKKGDKKEWEVYDENSTLPHHKPIDADGDPAKIAENPIMFDIDAIRKEVAALAAESKEYNAEAEFEIKEIKSTLPPMKIDISTVPSPPYSNLRETKSYNDSLATSSIDSKTATNGAHTSAGTSTFGKNTFEEYDEYDEGAEHMEMTFESSFREPSPSAIKSPMPASTGHSGASTPWEPTPIKSPWNPESQSAWDDLTPAERPPLKSMKTSPDPITSTNTNGNPGYNAWADEFDDDFGKEKEVQMTFM
ncbi:hypothetical protein IAQ61_004425 [Plenodomus lingam]|uniref:DUF726 domain protein n=1 Tax=Leptosphaeria maculans (strain JN3 / isolate v23.1.3 / race Av1-4-5-6-7-8) TaxID=985895 RepID=E4ZVH1_LEPMJ|nr:hypothetical protein LEMA_P027490.1 [Plenodomus lingam JN3]KAH9873798.1 hypothetical protein IAQ61_004425 [Plenodomus lingam]CBX95597.1 hypothetical protein LEMA_P027490.1 [Plenodomus lingam JN3]